MKDKAKRIFALSGVFICILVLLSNIIITIASASEMSLNDKMAYYVECIKREYFIKNRTDTEKYVSILYDNSVMETLFYDENDVIKYDNGIYFEGVTRLIVRASGFPFNTVENDDGTHITGITSWSDVNVNQKYILSENITFILTNDANMVEALKNIYNFTDDNVVGGLPLQMSEITFEHYYNKLSDLSHDITITNNSSKDIYYTLRCIMPQNMAAINSYEHLMYMYKEKQEYSGNSTLKYNQLVNSSAETAAEWISQYFTSQGVLSEYNLTQNEIYNNLMSNTAFWHRSNIYTSGTVGLPYMTAYNISQSEMGAESEHNAIIATLNNNVVNVSYTVDGFSSGNVYENSSIIKLSAGETKNINIPQNYMSLNSGVYYQWVLSVGETVEELTEHSRKGFTATTSNVGVIPPENIGSDKYVYDEQGNIIGEFDENGNIVIFDNNNNNTPSLDVPQFDTTSFKGIVSSVGEVVQMSYKMLPPEVYAIIAFGLGVVLAIGIIRLVTG